MSIPAKLGKYEIRRELGAGAMGVVYEGWDPGIARRVAIKTVKAADLAGAEADQTLARFRQEAQAAGRLSHPNIVQIYEFGEDAGVQFIAMEFIEGKELKDWFDADERFKLPEIARIMGELLAALGHAHKNGIVHRDIKPANIIILADGTVKVADFGIARIESSNLTQAGSVLGTPAYMSPEQFMGQTVDARSDLFSAGVVLYQFLTGEKPFTGSITTIMHKVLKEQPIAPSELNVQVPPAFDTLVRKALSKRPDERFQDAAEFSSAIAAAARGQGLATPVGSPADATLTGIAATDATLDGASPVAGMVAATNAAASVGADRPAAANSAPSPTRTPVLAVAAGLAVIVAAAGGWLLLGRAPAPAPQIAAPAAPAAPAPVAAVAEPGTAVITALGLADPADPRYAADKGLLTADLREDARRQLVEKAAALYVDDTSLAKHYGLLQTKLLARNGDYIQAIEEAQPQQTPDGLISLTAKATVKVRAVQKSLNQMSREERVDFIRNNGDPKISVAITSHSVQGGNTTDANAPAQRSAVAENLLKERIQSFGFRLWNDDMKDGADFAVTGEARFKKLSARLEASGITIEKFVLSSWSVKCTDKKSGEEIYYNNHIPEKQSWATEELALRDVGRLVGEEFSKNFFLQHFNFTPQKVALNITGLPRPELAQTVLRELTGMRAVLAIAPGTTVAGQVRFDAALSGGDAGPADLVNNGIAKPLNRKLGKTCFNVAGSSGAEVTLAFEPACADAATLGRLDTLPPAALFDAPAQRRDAVTRNPETLKKLVI